MQRKSRARRTPAQGAPHVVRMNGHTLTHTVVRAPARSAHGGRVPPAYFTPHDPRRELVTNNVISYMLYTVLFLTLDP